MIAVTVLVVQAEGNFLQPILLGRATKLHPLAVLLGLAAGATIAGIVGALLAIPVLAFSFTFIKNLRTPDSEPTLDPEPVVVPAKPPRPPRTPRVRKPRVAKAEVAQPSAPAEPDPSDPPTPWPLGP
jgi:hypothetical protein